MNYQCALFVVRDMAVARRFYEELLEQVPVYDYGENIGYRGFALHLAEHYRSLLELPPDGIAFGHHDAELYFENDDLDALAAKLQSAGVKFLHPVRTQPWQQRVMRFYDPDHHVIEVGESLRRTLTRLVSEGQSLAAAAHAMGLTEEEAMGMME